MPKDPARVKAGKKAWAKMSPAKKSKVLARLKRVRPKTKGTTKKSPAKGGGRGGSSPATGSNNKAPKIGASYLIGRAGVLVASPVTSQGAAILIGKEDPNLSGRMANIRDKTIGTQRSAYGKHLTVIAADIVVDKASQVQQAAAMSRRSVTAWAPEAYIAIRALEDATAKKSGREMHDNAIIRTTGYNPKTGAFGWTSGTWAYRRIKHGGQLIRVIANRTKIGQKIGRPVKAGLRMLGVTL